MKDSQEVTLTKYKTIYTVTQKGKIIKAGFNKDNPVINQIFKNEKE